MRSFPSASPFTANIKAVFWVVAALVYVLRAIYIIYFPEIFFWGDSMQYFETVVLFDKTGELIFHLARTPFYPVFILLCIKIFGILSIIIIQHITLCAMIIAMAYVLLSIYPNKYGLMVSLAFLMLSAFSPSQFLFVSFIMTEGLQTQFYIAVVIFYYLFSKRSRPVYLILLAGMIVCCIMLRPVNMILVPITALCLAPRISRKNLWRLAAFLCLAVLAVWPLAGRIPLSHLVGVNLAKFYGHLISIDTSPNREYKQAIRETHLWNLKQRAFMTKEQLLYSGNAYAFGESSYRDILMRRFNLPLRQAQEIVTSMVLEGIRNHPGQAAGLVLKKALYLYGGFAGASQKDYGRIVDDWAAGPFPAWAKGHYEKVLRFYGMPAEDDASRKQRYERAWFCIRPLERLTGFFAAADKYALWAGIILFPCVLFSARHRNLGLFVFLWIHGYIAALCVLVNANARFYQPLTVPVFFLLALEILAMLERALARRGAGRAGNSQREKPQASVAP